MDAKKYKVTLGNPCEFAWEKMTINGKGRHCSQCDKTVVDFTVMTDEEVVNYLFTHKNVCGHFNKSQLSRTMAVHIQKPKIKTYWPAIAAMLAAGIFQMTPLPAQTQNPSVTTGYKITVREESNNKNNPDHDSTITIKIKVIDAKSKHHLQNVSVEIPGIGSYTSDKTGYLKVSVYAGQLPKTITINAWASSYYTYIADIEIKEFIKNPVYTLEMWYDDPKMHVNGGDIEIKEDK
jgi:hypothetical protein